MREPAMHDCMQAAGRAYRWIGGAALCCMVLVYPFAAVNAQDAEGCGSAQDSAAGPYDYRTVQEKIRADVERNHFTRPVQMLVRGESTRVPGGVGRDISYTLHLMPNHPQALLAMMRLGEKEKVPRPRGARYPVDCYFERAIGFVPDDYNVRVLYGVHLARTGKAQEARPHLEMAAEKAPDDANVQYNLGLAYFEIKDYDKSLEHARRAYALGFALPGLRRKLEAEGKWAS
jgi:tetratricopeptide (TPR) repeat protein